VEEQISSLINSPIWVGGESRLALKRVAEFGDGWHIGLIPLERINPKIDELKRLMEQAGRDFSTLELTTLTRCANSHPLCKPVGSHIFLCGERSGFSP
jgi:alkanesulfonate monooxygenase SsuD/methylene tetrahydromethanopterin reductase-like flavin-dependent oxidoreductase (luciferase family)